MCIYIVCSLFTIIFYECKGNQKLTYIKEKNKKNKKNARKRLRAFFIFIYTAYSFLFFKIFIYFSHHLL